MKDAARLDDTRVDNVVVAIESLAADGHQIGMAKKCQMLGDIGLWDTQGLYEFFYGHFLLAEEVQDFEALRVGKDFVGFRVTAIGGSWERLLYFFGEFFGRHTSFKSMQQRDEKSNFRSKP